MAEGCYPYVVGGVSGWIHSLIQSFPNLEFIILSIISDRTLSGQFAYTLPENVTEVHELYLQDYDWYSGKTKRNTKRLGKQEFKALRSLILNQEVDWDMLFEMFRDQSMSVDELLMGEDFFLAVRDCYKLQYPQIVFSDFLWTMRSIYLPFFLALRMEVPEADLYHCVATGYAGVLGSMARHFFGNRLLISEHGIYTREREEELLKAQWVTGVYKSIWVEQFKKMSRLAYQRADMVTSLYEYARGLQIELGCPAHKTVVTPNGIDTARFAEISGPTPEDAAYVNIGAILRVTPIKDVKTMIQAFSFAKQKQSNLKLWVMGPCDEDPEYAQECMELVEALHVEDIVFTGRVNVTEYIGRMDMTILTSISEGQPLTILESYAAKKPVIATDVGNCRGLIFGEDGDTYGEAGILTHIMNIEEIAQAMIALATMPEKRRRMGECGYRRLISKYKIEDMKKTYEKIYRDFATSMGLEWSEEPFQLDLARHDQELAQKEQRKPDKNKRRRH